MKEKKLTVLFASPHADGFTSRLVKIFTRNFSGRVAVHNMYKKNIGYCVACDRCRNEKKCFMNDCDDIFEDIFSSDYLIFASPVYNYSFPAPMKIFLDRLQPFYYSHLESKNESMRKGFLLATCGQSGKFSAEIVEKQAKTAFYELSTEYCGSFLVANTDKKKTLQDDEVCKVKKLARDFFV